MNELMLDNWQGFQNKTKLVSISGTDALLPDELNVFSIHFERENSITVANIRA